MLIQKGCFSDLCRKQIEKKTKIIIRKGNYDMCMTDDRYFVDIKIIYFQTV